ncbi:MAG: glycosyltransferase family 9 protein [Tannerellaceae bacterium]|jgi:ADP-heptose:LPS heptosyltransferase|nr:glycosyltransferase family 9 protein [Tannerellaceae bacterium]
MARILVIRLSAIGDVAMTIPVIYSAARANPADTFTVLTQVFLIPVFINRPPNIEMMGINTFGAEKTLGGLLRFARAYSKHDFDIALDLHRVLRTQIICLLFRLQGKKVYALNKARRERLQLTAPAGKKTLKPIRSVIDRYADVFKAAGLNCTDTFGNLFDGRPPAPLPPIQGLNNKQNAWIGIAPFARHAGKIYPLNLMEQVVATLATRENLTIILFGGRGNELQTLNEWAARHNNVINAAGRYSLDAELSLISHLDLLVSMDSANMHFASLVQTPVISIWGATHPNAGFYGYHQNPANAIQLNLPCRPCSIYGQKPCHRHDYACLTQLPPQTILAQINQIIPSEKKSSSPAKQ